jgi:Flp pilus assembly CpaF family ATPase
MNEAISDGIRHLEKDMAEIIDLLADESTTEVILNPRRNYQGSFIGQILVETNNSGLKNLIRKNEAIMTQLKLQVGDNVVYKYCTATGKILFWIKLGLDHSQNIDQLTLLLICYFGANIIEQTTDVNLFDLKEQIKELYKHNNANTLDYIIATINQNLSQMNNEAIKKINIDNENQLLNFIPYPEKIILNNLVTMKFSKVETIISVLASITGKHIHAKSPYLECQIPKYGHRFTGVIPPVVPYPAFCIRKHSSKILSLSDLLQQGILELNCYETIINWIKRKFNILIAGGTGSGKTTLANAILLEIGRLFPATRILIIEDVPELKFNTNYSLSFTVGEFFSMYDALRLTLRFKPERIVMGEIRGAEAYTLLKAWNTGHPGGVATIHANSVHEALWGC